MYLVLSALTSIPISLVVPTKASAFSFRVCMLPPSILTSSLLQPIEVENDRGVFWGNDQCY